MDNRISVAITGASGAPYALRLISCLLGAGKEVHLIISDAGRLVLADELDLNVPANAVKARESLRSYFKCDENELLVYDLNDWHSPLASGSAAPKQMVICPCSGGTLSAVATGASNNLIERAADVVLKERGNLILLFRELPLSLVHIENIKTLVQSGACVMPASPGFYHRPVSVNDLVDFVVGRILDQLNIGQEIMPKWGYGQV